MDGQMKGLAAVVLCDKDDPTRLSSKELKEGWGGPAEFMLSYGLKPFKPEDCHQALAFSRALQEADMEDQMQQKKSSESSESRVEVLNKDT